MQPPWKSSFTVAAGEAGMRLDVLAARHAPGLSRSRVQALIREGRVLVQGRPVKAHQTPPAGARVAIEVPPVRDAAGLTPEDIPLDVLYEDADIVVVNKPAGLVVHPAAGHAGGTLVNALLHRCGSLPGIGGERRPGIVHRLDKNTSGVLVSAKSQRAMAGLVRQFKNAAPAKEYRALVWGRPKPARGRIETLIGRSVHDRKKMSAQPKIGRRAVTLYETLEAFARTALLGVRILTGRTHQIRVHMAHIGCPVLGDAQYGGRRRGDLPAAPSRQMLHAYRLSFSHPCTGQNVAFTAPMPADMEQVLHALRGSARLGQSAST